MQVISFLEELVTSKHLNNFRLRLWFGQSNSLWPIRILKPFASLMNGCNFGIILMNVLDRCLVEE
ncbi:hypothetical protein LDENG_00299200 [Lucifuga dentata]|nr:hypothetical protein LDENG_00299200 [Lucifuga dentata]